MMKQTAYICSGMSTIQVELPNEDDEVLPGVKWGNIAGFPTVAFWAFKVIERRLENQTIQYKLGQTLIEETAVCLLGGHGIPASMGNAAFAHLKNKGAFTGDVISQERLYKWLAEPIEHNGKPSKYRFAKQKAAYLHSALAWLAKEEHPTTDGKTLRNWLMGIKGVGPKTASWVARNWLEADDVAILDIHIYRAGLLAKFFDKNLTVEKNYFELEESFLQLAKAIGVRASELDAVMWYEMQQAGSMKHQLEQLENEDSQTSSTWQRAYQSKPKTHQLSLL